MSLASQLISLGYLLLLGLIWGFLWEFLEEISTSKKKGAVILLAFMLPISGLIWYIGNGGSLRYYVPLAVGIGVLVFSILSRRTLGSAIALGLGRIFGGLSLLFSIIWLFLRLGVESLSFILYSIFRRIKTNKNTIPKFNQG
mgnify:FL=1